MALIKRYPNRKLYHTEAKQYITLDEIAELIRAGDDVRVVDYATGDDLTTLTFTQIILEQEKQNAGFLPQSILASLVRAGGKTRRAVRRALVNSLGFWNQIDEEIKRRVELLVNRGELTAEEAIHLSKKLLSIQDKSGHNGMPYPDLSDIEGILLNRGVPTREEFQNLMAELDKLTEMVDEIIK
ncbi:MAG: hypothetical protein MUO64_18725 [Anaerolineales bacterium]|nr:hypothetical protein [Anaerolineales bacterium]